MSGPRSLSRRDLLRAGGVALAGGSAGCQSLVASGCPDPTLENELDYDGRILDVTGKDFIEGSGITLVTEREGLDELRLDSVSQDVRTWVEETDFSGELLVAVTVGVGGGAGPPTVLGIDREGPETIRVYLCLGEAQRPSQSEYGIILRSQYEGKTPEQATFTVLRSD